jgi:hypothetical protein
LCEEENFDVDDDDDVKRLGISKAVRRMRFKTLADDVSAEAMKRRATIVNLMVE